MNPTGSITIMHMVARYRLDSIRELALQMGFAPVPTRLEQVAAAEELLHSIDPGKAYPLEFVVFRVTGYHPRTVSVDLLAGAALQHDLGALIEEVCDALDLRTRDFTEPVLSIDDVTERFSVTSKTIQRWRRRGLPARRFVFPDGKRRVGFLLGSVERFLATHRDAVERASNFTQVTAEERDEMLRRARRLATMCHCCVHEIARRIARRMRRSPLTILHTIRKHDEENPAAAIFVHAPQPMGEDERGRILRARKSGVPMRSLAKRLCRPRSAIYRVIVDDRLARLARRKVRFIDDPLYHQPDAEQQLRAMVDQEPLTASPPAEATRVPRDLPPYLAELYRVPLLTPAQERALFLQFNFYKRQFVLARRRLEPQTARARDINLLSGLARRATEVKNRIVRANLRLVVSVARRHARPNVALMELVSEGNLTLMRAVESFDVHRGHRFSTYATLSLMKGFARSVPAIQSMHTPRGVRREALSADLPDERPRRDEQSLLRRDELQALLGRLEPRERDVLASRYGIDAPDLTRRPPQSYDELGARLGISKARVRQIEQHALARLRAAVDPAGD